MPFFVPFRIILSRSSLNKNHCVSVQKSFKIHSSSGDTTWVQAAAISSNLHTYTALWHSSCNYQAAQGNPYRFLARFPYRTWAKKQITLAGKLQSKPANEEWIRVSWWVHVCLYNLFAYLAEFLSVHQKTKLG